VISITDGQCIWRKDDFIRRGGCSFRRIFSFRASVLRADRRWKVKQVAGAIKAKICPPQYREWRLRSSCGSDSDAKTQAIRNAAARGWNFQAAAGVIRAGRRLGAAVVVVGAE